MRDITRDIKKRIFALYWGQTVLHIPDDEIESMENTPLTINDSFMGLNKGIELGYLLLNPLSSINDEDAIECAILYKYNIRGGVDTASQSELFRAGKELIDDITLNRRVGKSANIIIVSDFLRSSGYALPYLNWTVDELVEAGAFKLKS